MQTFPYGAVLKIQREHSMEDIRVKMDGMKGLGMNFVVVWPAVYWWEDRSSPNYPFQTGHEILKYAGKIGIKIIMELAGQITALEYAPDFIMKDEYYAVTCDNIKDLNCMAYGFINFNHPEVRQLTAKQFSEAAEQYKGYSSLYGYDIWNETMFTSYDIHTLQLFRDWLKNKYKSIERLNEVWDRVYYDWSQIHFTSWLWASVMPKVDYEQFHKDNIGLILLEWRNVVRSVDTKHPVIADNIHSMITVDEFYNRPADDWNVAENVDEFGISFYPKINRLAMEPNIRWETLTGIHSATKSGRFWISEMQTHHQSMFNPFNSVYPHDLRWWNWEAISHGAKGMIYWKWDPFIKGVQTFGRGLVDPGGKYTKRSDEAAAIGQIIFRNEKEFLEYEPEQPRVAILYDRLSHDFIKAYTLLYERNLSNKIYTDSLAGLYKCLWEQNIPSRFVTPDNVISKDIGQFKVLFITNQLNISAQLAEGLRHFASYGGIIICDGKLGEIDDFGILQTSVPGAGFHEDAGFELMDMEPDNLKISLKWDGHESIELNGYYDRRRMNLTGKNTEVSAVFDDGEPAILRTRLGKGEIVYMATFMWYGYYMENHSNIRELVKLLDTEYGLHLHKIDENSLKFCTMKGHDGWMVFVFNYSSRTIGSKIWLKDVNCGKCEVRNLYTGDIQTGEVVNNELEIQTAVNGNDVSVYLVKRG